jgi:4-carboxymuconolactone decarboxylase
VSDLSGESRGPKRAGRGYGEGQVSDAAFERVKAAFGECGVMDLVGGVGYYSLVSMVLNVARVPLPAGVEPPLK